MISISKLLCGVDAESDGLRYDAAEDSSKPQIRESKQQRPVVVWNITKQCNLYCDHCYAAADTKTASGELTTTEGKHLLDQLANYDVPVVLFSGGEPLVRNDLVELVDYASDMGLRPVLSTNGTLLTEERVQALIDAGVAYAGISVDGLPEHHDAFRGQKGAFEAAVEGIKTCLDAGLKTGLRYTITRRNADHLEAIVDLLHDVGVDRFCFYHLEYGGRGSEIVDIDLTPEERRNAVRQLFDLTLEYHDSGKDIETLLVGNYADAAYIIEYAYEKFGENHAREVYEYLRRNGGAPAGERIVDIDYQGNVHPTQFWQDYSLGNVRDRPFVNIWEDESNPLLSALRHCEEYLKEKCTDCAYRDVCRGSSRLRALTTQNDLFAPDPQCYLTEDERAKPIPVDSG